MREQDIIKKRWTDTEKNYLLENHKTKNIAEIATFLGRSSISVRRKIARLNAAEYKGDEGINSQIVSKDKEIFQKFMVVLKRKITPGTPIDLNLFELKKAFNAYRNEINIAMNY